MSQEREEIEHIITEMTKKDMYKDLAMMFITGHIDYFDIFFCEYSAPKGFYVRVFRYIALYVKRRIDSGKISDLNRDIFSRLYCNQYSNVSYFDFHVNKNYFSSKLVEAVLDELTSKADFHNVNYIISTLASNDMFNISVIVDILKKNELIAHHYVIEDLINSEILSMSELYDLLVRKSKEVDFSDIKHLILTLFRNKVMLLDFTEEVMAKYEIYTYEDKRLRKVLVINYIGEPKYKEETENIRAFLADIIWTDAEIDMYDWLEECKRDGVEVGDIFVTKAYNSYLNWFRSDIRMANKTANYVYYGFEDTDSDLQVDKEYRHKMQIDLGVRQYWYDLSLVNGYEFFIKLFNINRFRCLHYEDGNFLANRIAGKSQYEPNIVNLACRDETYYFIKL